MEQVMSRIKTIIKRRGLLIAAGLTVIIAILYLVFALPTSGIVTPIKNQLAAIRDDDNVTAYSYTSIAFQKATSLQAFTRFIKEYSSLRNNNHINISSRNIKYGVGVVKATLISRGGVETPVVYQLVKENSRWKIESIIITPQGDDQLKAEAAANANKPEPAPVLETTSNDTPHTYHDDNHDYTLIYPDEWQYHKSEDNKVVFNGRPGSISSQSTLIIQPFSAENRPQSVHEVAEKNEAELSEQSPSLKIVEDGLLPPRSNKNERYHGKYTVYSYTINNQPMRQLQVIYFKSPKRVQYVIDFISPESQFDTDLPAARAMIASFKIS